MIASGREVGVRTDLAHGPSEIRYLESPANQMFVILSLHPLSFFFTSASFWLSSTPSDWWNGLKGWRTHVRENPQKSGSEVHTTNPVDSHKRNPCATAHARHYGPDTQRYEEVNGTLKY